MNQIYGWKQKWLEIYSGKSKYIDLAVRFIVGLLIFSYINGQVGYISAISNFLATIGLAAAGAILSYGGIMTIASIVIVLQVFSESMVLGGVLLVVFLLLFIVYFRFTSDLSAVVILTPVSLALGMPAAVPIACALLVGPLTIIPMSVGTIVYVLIKIVSDISESLSGELSLDGVLEDALLFVEQLKENREIIFYIVVLAIVNVVVFLVRKLQVPHAWKIAVGSGYLVAFIFSLVLGGILGVNVSFIVILLGNLMAVVVGLIVEILFLGVDYKKTEVVEFEDDEYHYYVKMVPKIGGERRPKRRRANVAAELPQEVEYEDDVQDEIEELELQDIELSEEDRELAYVTDLDLGDGQTMVIDSDEIERELRSNAVEKSMNSDENTTKHLEANYEMLKKTAKRRNRNRKR